MIDKYSKTKGVILVTIKQIVEEVTLLANSYPDGVYEKEDGLVCLYKGGKIKNGPLVGRGCTIGLALQRLGIEFVEPLESSEKKYSCRIGSLLVSNYFKDVERATEENYPYRYFLTEFQIEQDAGHTLEACLRWATHKLKQYLLGRRI